MPKRIQFFAADTGFSLRNRNLLRNWIESVIRKEGFTLSKLNYIFCSDDYLLRINIEHLNHKSLTDIITFDLADQKKMLEGEIYISIDRVRENAAIYNVPFYNELCRVMVHGVLHLCGYKDKKPADVKKMRKKEELYITKLPQ